MHIFFIVFIFYYALVIYCGFEFIKYYLDYDEFRLGLFIFLFFSIIIILPSWVVDLYDLFL